jgi:hypothetical protein
VIHLDQDRRRDNPPIAGPTKESAARLVIAIALVERSNDRASI